MKPKYIFSAVIAVCMLLFAVLPRLAYSPHAASAAALLAPTFTPAVLDSAPATPTAPPVPVVVNESAAQPTAPPAAPAAAAAAQNAAGVAENAAGGIPVPANPAPANPAGEVPQTAGVPEMAAFIASVANGPADTPTGVYVPGVFALPISQQPVGQDDYVSSTDGELTQYGRAALFGTIGLLAHNTLSGRIFYQLQPGQEVVLVYGNGGQARYKINRIENYQALSSHDTHSDFVDLNQGGGKVINHETLFGRVYGQPNQLVFQTCFEANGDPSWGRTFVIAQAQ